MPKAPLGQICWYELMTTDPDGAVDFYKAVVGWGTEVFDGPEPYTMWTNAGQPIGGVTKLPEQALAAGAPAHWEMYVSTPDLDGTLAKAEGLGGSLAWGPEEVPTVGRFAGMRDPQGAVVAILQPASEAPGSTEPAPVGTVAWHELTTEDGEAAFRFYTEMFGWTHDSDFDMGEMGLYRMFTTGAHPVGGIMNRPPMMPMSMWLLYVRVADLEKALELVKANGGQVLNGPMEVPGGDRIAQCVDPQGCMFALHHKTE